MSERNDSGQFGEKVSLQDVIAVFERVKGPVVTSGDVADELNCSRETARRKLRTLQDRERVDSRKTAGRVVWWRVEADKPSPINPDDPFFTDRPTFASGSSDTSERVDEILYGKNSNADA